MVSIDSSKNNPLPIEDNPLPELILTDGHLYPWVSAVGGTLPVHPEENPLPSIPQEAPELTDGTGVEGIKLYASRALGRARMWALALALEILRDAGLMGMKDVTFSMFFKPLVGHLGKSTARVAWNCLRGISPNRNKTKGKYRRDAIQNRKKLLELFVIFAHSYNKVRACNSDKQLAVGRPETTVDIPSEGELAELLLRAGLIEEADINDQNVFKSWNSLSIKKHYRGLIGTGEYVKRNGERQYPRSELAKLTDCSLSTARKDAEWTDTKVEPMEPSKKPFKKEDRETLPANFTDLEEAQKKGLFPGGIHFEPYLGDAWFPYTKTGYDACVATGTKRVMECRYQASKYYPSDSVQIIQ
jgi:hypothetical protein